MNNSTAILNNDVRKELLAVIMIAMALLSGISGLSAQNNTLYLMHLIPQANQLNPAVKHPCRIYLALPVISSVRQSIRNTGFGFHDAIRKGAGSQSDTYLIDTDNLERLLKKMNYSLVSTDIDLLGFGFAASDWYFTFGLSAHSYAQGSYPNDIVSVKDGNWDVTAGDAIPVNLSRMGVNATGWYSAGISASREFAAGLRAGARIRYLNGMANINTRRSELELNTTSDPVTLQADVNYKINSSFPVTLGYDQETGLVNSIDLEPARHNIVGNYIFNGNFGMALDGGVVYDLDELTQVSASFTGLGFFRWKKNVNNLTGNGKFVYEGVDLNDYVNDPDQDDIFGALRDSIVNAFTAANEVKPYFTSPPLNLYGGITRELVPGISAGAMTWIEYNSGHIRPSLTFSLNMKPFNVFAATVSYTLMNSKIDQVGAGLAFGNRGTQFYLLTDNIPVRFTRYANSSLIWPYNARMLSLRFGFNFLFGCSEKDDREGGRAGSGTAKRSSGPPSLKGKMPKKSFPKSSKRGDCPAYW